MSCLDDGEEEEKGSQKKKKNGSGGGELIRFECVNVSRWTSR